MRRLVVLLLLFCLLFCGLWYGYGKSWVLSRVSEEASRAVVGKVTIGDVSLGWFSLSLHDIFVKSFLGEGTAEEVGISFVEYSRVVSKISVTSPRLSVTLPVSGLLPILSNAATREKYFAKYREYRLAASSPAVMVRDVEFMLQRRESRESLRVKASSWSWEGFSPVTVGSLWERGSGTLTWPGGRLMRDSSHIEVEIDDLASVGRVFVLRKPEITSGRGSLRCEGSSCRFSVTGFVRGSAAARELFWEVPRDRLAERDLLLFVLWGWGVLWEKLLLEDASFRSSRGR